jgi:hypothetical protein
MTTEWKWRLFLFVRASDATTENKRTVAKYLANNGSMETVEDEMKMFASCVRLSTSGESPAQAFGMNLAVKPAMREAIVNFLSTLDRPRYAVLANTELENYQDTELMATNFPVTPNGQLVTWQMALNYLEAEFGLIVILDETEI